MPSKIEGISSSLHKSVAAGDTPHTVSQNLSYNRRAPDCGCTTIFEMVVGVAAAHPNLIAYLRVSSEAQDTQLQRDALTEAGCSKFFDDKIISSRKTDRPGLTAALDYLRCGDTLAVWKLGRSVTEVLTIADELRERGIGLRILTGTLAVRTAPPGRASSSSPSWPHSPSSNAT